MGPLSHLPPLCSCICSKRQSIYLVKRGGQRKEERLSFWVGYEEEKQIESGFRWRRFKSPYHFEKLGEPTLPMLWPILAVLCPSKFHGCNASTPFLPLTTNLKTKEKNYPVYLLSPPNHSPHELATSIRFHVSIYLWDQQLLTPPGWWIQVKKLLCLSGVPFKSLKLWPSVSAYYKSEFGSWVVFKPLSASELLPMFYQTEDICVSVFQISHDLIYTTYKLMPIMSFTH